MHNSFPNRRSADLRAVVEGWGQFHDEGWGAVAGKAGIAKRPDAMQRLKRAITSSYERWGRPLAAVPEALPQEDGDAKPAPGKGGRRAASNADEGVEKKLPVHHHDDPPQHPTHPPQHPPAHTTTHHTHA